MKKSHMNASDAFIVTSELIGLKDKFKIGSVHSFLLGTFVSGRNPIVVAGAGNACDGTEFLDILEIALHGYDFMDDLVFSTWFIHNQFLGFLSLPSSVIFFRNSTCWRR